MAVPSVFNGKLEIRPGKSHSLNNCDSLYHQVDGKVMLLDNTETTDSDDDLPVCVRNISTSKRASTPNNACDHKDFFADIFEKQLEFKEETGTILQNREQLDTIVKASADVNQSTVIKSELEIDDESVYNDFGMLPNDNLIEEYPGELILDPSERGKLFTRSQLTFKKMVNPISTVDVKLQGLNSKLIEELIKSRLLILYFPRLTDKAVGLQLLFRLMSIHEDQLVVIKCKDILMSLLKTHPAEAEAISLHEVLQVLVNSGTTLKKIIPIPELLAAVEKVVPIKAQCEEGTSDAKEAVYFPDGTESTNLQMHCLEGVLQVLQYLISHGLSKTLIETDSLMILAVALTSLALDTNIRTSMVVYEIRIALDEILLRFSGNDWDNRVILLSKYLSSISEISQNMAFVSLLFCLSARGRHLQRLTSFQMCHRLLGKEYPHEMQDVTPHNVLSFLKSVIWRSYSDLCILYNVIALINLCVGQNFFQDNWKVLLDLSSVVKKIARGIKSEQSAIDRIKIEALVTNISMKWNILANSQPKSQKSLFAFTD